MQPPRTTQLCEAQGGWCLRAVGNVTGGAPRDLDEVHSSPDEPAPHRPQRGQTSTEYLADLVEVEGDPITEVEARPPRPDVVWVSAPCAGTGAGVVMKARAAKATRIDLVTGLSPLPAYLPGYPGRLATRLFCAASYLVSTGSRRGRRVYIVLYRPERVGARQQAGHMDASDLIKTLQNTLQGGGRPYMGNVDLITYGAPELPRNCVLSPELRAASLLSKEWHPRHAYKNANHMERYRWDFPACRIGGAGMG